MPWVFNVYYMYMFIEAYLGVLLIVVIYCLLWHSRTETLQIGGADVSGWHQDKNCKYQMLKVLNHFVEANELNQNTEDNWSIYLPCGYNRAEQELQAIQSSDPEQKIFIIKGHDNLSRKDKLWESLQNTYGDRAQDIMPKTYQLRIADDFQRLMNDYTPGKVYILKKNIQRQQGLWMTTDKLELVQGRDRGYVIAQEMLQDPYLLDGRKTNCRIYLLIVCKAGKKTGYLYNNGYMYYTPKPFQINSTDKDRVITAGLSTERKDEEFYQTHPLTMQEWQANIDVDIDLFVSAGALLNRVLTATSPNFCTGGHLQDRTTFQLFGCDIAFNNRLIPQLIEINKGPDLSSKSDKETALKNDLITCMFKQVGVSVQTPTHGIMIPIWNSDGI